MTKRNRGGITIHRPKTRSDFQELDSSLARRGFVAYEVLKKGFSRATALGRDYSPAQAEDMACGMVAGSMSGGPLTKVAWSFDSMDMTPTPVTKDGKALGRGYVKWGPYDNIPSQIYGLAKSSPYTAAPLRYLSDLATGLGVRYMYRFPDGSSCEFKDAGDRLRKEMEDLEDQEPGLAAGAPALTPDGLPGAGALNGTRESLALKRAREAYQDWRRTWFGEDVGDGNEERDGDGNVVREETYTHIPGAKEFTEGNDLDRHFSNCMQEFNMFDLFFPTVGFERGRRGSWNPKIVSVGFLSIVHGGVRYEVMNEYRHIQNIYFGEKFRAKGITGAAGTTAGGDNDVTMYPVAEQNRRVEEWRYTVSSNQRRSPSARPTWSVCPVAYGTRNYYQQPDWWSIFTIKAFDFSSTILYDKAKARENSTSWGKIFYISLDYLDKVFADNGIEGKPDEQEKFIDELEQSMENFLQHRENHGKMMRQWMWSDPNGKDHHNVEVVDVAETTNDVAKAGKEELELSTNPIFLAFGVDPRDVGVPMVTASNGGTALREIRLMKQQLLNIRQRMYVKFLTDISTFNRWSERGFWAVKQMTFTTLDNSKTGTVETIAGEGA